MKKDKEERENKDEYIETSSSDATSQVQTQAKSPCSQGSSFVKK